MEEEGNTMPSRSTFASRLRLVSALTTAVALTLGYLPAFAAAPTDALAPTDAASCVRLELDNPHAGDVVPLGKYNVSGRAFDASGAAIDRVQIFLEDRNLGGIQIGEADLNPPDGAPALVAQSSIADNGIFTALTDTSGTSSDIGSHTLFAYAHSTSGTEVSVAVPLVLRNPNAPTPGGAGASLSNALPNVSNSAACPPPAPPTNQVSPTGTNVTATAAGPAPVNETITVRVDSPHPGASVTRGRFIVSGKATTNTGGPIDRVQVFLDNRDLGGINIGEITAADSPMAIPNTQLVSTLNSDGTYDVVVSFPAQNLGVHTVWVYAHSGATGKEASANTSVTVTH